MSNTMPAAPITFTSDKYVLAHNGTDVFHVLRYTPPALFFTGQPNTESFDDPLDLVKRVKELGGNVAETSAVWPEGKVPIEQNGQLSWVDAPAPSSDSAA